MTTYFDPHKNKLVDAIKDYYLSCDSNNQFTLVEKKTRVLAGWLIGKIIHWILHPSERLSRVRDVFQKLADSKDSTKSLAERSRLLLHTTGLNEIIERHNKHWICTILFWAKIPKINDFKLQYDLSGEISAGRDFLQTYKWNPLDPIKSLQSLHDVSEKLSVVDGRGSQTVKLKETLAATKAEIEKTAQSWKDAQQLTDADFTLLKNVQEVLRVFNNPHYNEFKNLNFARNAYEALNLHCQNLKTELTSDQHYTEDLQDRVKYYLDNKFVEQKNKNALYIAALNLHLEECKLEQLSQIKAEADNFTPITQDDGDDIQKTKERIAQLETLIALADQWKQHASTPLPIEELRKLQRSTLEACEDVKKVQSHPIVEKMQKMAQDCLGSAEKGLKDCERWREKIYDMQQNNVSVLSVVILSHKDNPETLRVAALTEWPESAEFEKFIKELPAGNEKDKLIERKAEFDKHQKEAREFYTLLKAAFTTFKELLTSLNDVTAKDVEQLSDLLKSLDEKHYYRKQFSKILELYKSKLAAKPKSIVPNPLLQSYYGNSVLGIHLPKSITLKATRLREVEINACDLNNYNKHSKRFDLYVGRSKDSTDKLSYHVIDWKSRNTLGIIPYTTTYLIPYTTTHQTTHIVDTFIPFFPESTLGKTKQFMAFYKDRSQPAMGAQHAMIWGVNPSGASQLFKRNILGPNGVLDQQRQKLQIDFDKQYPDCQVNVRTELTNIAKLSHETLLVECASHVDIIKTGVKNSQQMHHVILQYPTETLFFGKGTIKGIADDQFFVEHDIGDGTKVVTRYTVGNKESTSLLPIKANMYIEEIVTSAQSIAILYKDIPQQGIFKDNAVVVILDKKTLGTNIKWEKTWVSVDRTDRVKARHLAFLNDDILMHYRGEYDDQKTHESAKLDLELYDAETGVSIPMPEQLNAIAQRPAKDSLSLVELDRQAVNGKEEITLTFSEFPKAAVLKQHLVKIEIDKN